MGAAPAEGLVIFCRPGAGTSTIRDARTVQLGRPRLGAPDMVRPNWNTDASSTIDRSVDHADAWADYRTANAEMIERTLRGTGPHATSVSKGGMRVVYNISTAYIPNFMRASAAGPAADPNRYDIKKANRQLGAGTSGADLRERIDDVVAAVGWPGGTNVREDLYYGAVELNGAGIRYFGDACLVLKPEAMPKDFLFEPQQLRIFPASRWSTGSMPGATRKRRTTRQSTNWRAGPANGPTMSAAWPSSRSSKAGPTTGGA